MKHETQDIVTTVAQVVHETIRGYRNAMHAVFPEQSGPDFRLIEPWEACDPEQVSAAQEVVKYLMRYPDAHHGRGSTIEQAGKVLGVVSDVAQIGVVAAEHALASIGLTVEPGCESDRTGVGGVQ